MLAAWDGDGQEEKRPAGIGQEHCGVTECGSHGGQAPVTGESTEVNGELGPSEDVSGPGVWDVQCESWCQGVLPSWPGLVCCFMGRSLEIWSMHRAPSALREQQKVGEGTVMP